MRDIIERLPGWSEDIPPETWRCEEQDLPYVRALLVAAGVDLSASSIDRALATARPVILDGGALEYLNQEERAEYDHERRVLEQSAWPT